MNAATNGNTGGEDDVLQVQCTVYIPYLWYLIVGILVFILTVSSCVYGVWKFKRQARVIKMIEKACETKDKKALCDAIEQGETIQLKNFVLSKPREVLKQQKRKFVDQRTLLEALELGDTKLVKGSYLLTSDKMVRCQDLPQDEAFWKVANLTALYKRIEVVAISYCWIEPGHPDPHGEQLQIFQKIVELRLGCQGQTRVLDLAIFLDFLSMAQDERTQEEEVSFKRALADVNLWYAHQDTVVWLQTWLPERVVHKYNGRGWPRFERAVSMMITDGDNLLDLAPGGKSIAHDSECVDFQTLWHKCHASRKPPRLPEAFEEVLQTLHFTNGSDREFVAKKYKETFQEVLDAAEELWFAELGWKDEDAYELAEVLPHCHSLVQISLIGNQITCKGAKALVAASANCPTLASMDLTDNQIDRTGTDDAGSAPDLKQSNSLAHLREMWLDMGKETSTLRMTARSRGSQAQVSEWACSQEDHGDGDLERGPLLHSPPQKE
jgi:hypothetical protein